MVQPVSIAYRASTAFRSGGFCRPFFAWYGDMAMAPHLWQMLGLGQLTVVIEFHAPVDDSPDFGSRKALVGALRQDRSPQAGRDWLAGARAGAHRPAATDRRPWQRSERRLDAGNGRRKSSSSRPMAAR